MPRLIWISLAAGYAMGLIGALVYLPGEVLVPIAWHGSVLAASIVAVTGLGLWLRRRRAAALSRGPAAPETAAADARGLARWLRRTPAGDRAGATGQEAGHEAARAAKPRPRRAAAGIEPVGAGTSPAAASDDAGRYRSPLAALTAAVLPDVPVSTTRGRRRIEGRALAAGGPANDREGAASRESMAGRGGLRARSALTPGASDRAAGAVAAGGNRLRCTTQPLVVLPQRRLAGLVVTGHLATTGNRATSRRELYALDLPRAELHKFDGALVERALALVRRHGTELAGHRLVVEASAAALAEAAIVEQITALARDPFTRDVDLVLVLDAAEGPRLPSAPPTLPGNLALAVRCDDLGQIDGEGLIAAGIGQVTVAHGVLDAHAAMPLEDDPLRRRLAMLVEAGLEVTVEGLGRESDVLDALDYPIALATGALFGAPSAVMADGACTFFTARTEPPPRARQPLVQRISPSV